MTIPRAVRAIALQYRRTHRIEPSPKAHQISGLTRIDYTDAFRADVTVQRSPRDWVREVFEGPRWPLPALLHLLWSKCVGLDLSPRSDRARVLGWRIATQTADAAVLASDAPGMRVRLVALTEPSAVSWTTTIYYQKWYGRIIFAFLGHFHRAMAKYLLVRAAAG